MDTPKHRFRFGMRLLFILVTVSAGIFGWVAWEVKGVRARQLLAARLNDRDGKTRIMGRVLEGSSEEWMIIPIAAGKPRRLVRFEPTSSSQLNAMRCWLGDVPYAVVVVLDSKVCPDVRRHFPEATVVELNGDGAEVTGPRRTVNFPVGLQDIGKSK
jgi:hypothetical protein